MKLARRELAAQWDGAVPSSSCLEIVVPELRDEEDQELAPQLDLDNLRIGERSAPQPNLDNLFDVELSKSTEDSLAEMFSSCGNAHCIGIHSSWKGWQPLDSSSRIHLHVWVLLHSMQPLVLAAEVLCRVLSSAWNSVYSIHSYLNSPYGRPTHFGSWVRYWHHVSLFREFFRRST